MGILDNATATRYEWPDGSSIVGYLDGVWYATKGDGWNIFKINENGGRDAVKYDSPEAAAQALADLGMGPASVKQTPDPSQMLDLLRSCHAAISGILGSGEIDKARIEELYIRLTKIGAGPR